MLIVIYSHNLCFSLHWEIICRMFHQRLKVAIMEWWKFSWVFCIVQVSERRNDRKKGRKADKPTGNGELVRTLCKDMTCQKNTTISGKVLGRDTWFLSKLLEKEAVVSGHWVCFPRQALWDSFHFHLHDTDTIIAFCTQNLLSNI